MEFDSCSGKSFLSPRNPPDRLRGPTDLATEIRQQESEFNDLPLSSVEVKKELSHTSTDFTEFILSTRTSP
jgi:hypothetical protein